MAKRKKSKDSRNTGMSTELTGLLLVLLGFIGFGFGYVGMIIKEFAMFLMGSWWIILVIFTLIVGMQMLFNKKTPKFFSTRYIGFYLVMIAILGASHFGFLDGASNIPSIIENTFNQFMERISTITSTGSVLSTGNTSISIGGGFLGSLIISLLYFLFAKTGSIVVLTIVGFVGIILVLDITLADVIAKIKKLFKRNKNRVVEEDQEEELDELTKELFVPEVVKKKEDKRIVDDEVKITSLEDVKKKEITPVVEEKPIVIDTTPVLSSNTHFHKPSIDILNKPKEQKNNVNLENVKKNALVLKKVLKDFQLSADVVDYHVGPAVTQYEITVPAGTKVSRILSINKEIALALAAKDVRIEAPIPGKSTIGIEIPNAMISSVPFREVIEANEKDVDKYGIMITLGKNLMGKPIVADLTKMPHLLVAGSTGSGKSVCINSIICSIFMNYTPTEVKLVLVDPKKVELTNYNGDPHLYCPVVTDPKKASIALQNVVAEMERRYNVFSDKGVKKISEYNDYIKKENKKHPETPLDTMPFWVVIIDELADLMLVASKEVEDSIMRITQMARAAGIHLIVATQRPSTDVITGVVKANIPSRICFAVASQIDSRTALDMGGAEKLLGKGDMLYLPMGENTPERIQGCFIADDEIQRLIDHWSKQQKGSYDETFTEKQGSSNTSSGSGNGEDGYDDPMYNEIVDFAIETGKISASLIQRKFRFGFNRAARMIDLLESRGIVGPQNGSKPREVLVKKKEVDE